MHHMTSTDQVGRHGTESLLPYLTQIPTFPLRHWLIDSIDRRHAIGSYRSRYVMLPGAEPAMSKQDRGEKG
jgi:hypothetical protein